MGLDSFNRGSKRPEAFTEDELGIGEPLLEDSQEFDKRGRMIEFLAAAKLAEHGYGVSFPVKEASFDLIAVTSNNTERVQVKSTTNDVDKRGSTYYQVQLMKKHWGQSQDGMKQTDFDTLAVYVIPTENWYVIPTNAIKGSTAVILSEDGKYGVFRNQW